VWQAKNISILVILKINGGICAEWLRNGLIDDELRVFNKLKIETTCGGTDSWTWSLIAQSLGGWIL
jgi:hypothetical protein